MPANLSTCHTHLLNSVSNFENPFYHALLLFGRLNGLPLIFHDVVEMNGNSWIPLAVENFAESSLLLRATVSVAKYHGERSIVTE